MTVAAPARFSRLLREKISLVSASSRPGVTIWNHPALPQFYPELLFVGHCIIRASVPLMQAALQQAAAIGTEERVARQMMPYLSHHAAEELHHDEWLLDDLEALGMQREQVLTRMPPAAVAQLVGAQYYWVLHHHPAAVLGYIAVLEGSPLEAAELEAAAATSGLPRKAFRTLLKHAQLDPGHRDDLDALLDALPLSKSHASLIGSSAILTSVLLDEAFARALPADLTGA
jgi:hypothetical protein